MNHALFQSVEGSLGSSLSDLSVLFLDPRISGSTSFTPVRQMCVVDIPKVKRQHGTFQWSEDWMVGSTTWS